MADIEVLITVDTENITPSNLTSTVVLTDNKGDTDSTPGDSSTFDIKANGNNTIGFSIVSKNGTTGTSLNYFTFESGSSLFSSLPSADNDWVGTVADVGTQNLTEQFSITFKVAGNINSPFTLDPALKTPQK